MTRQQLTIIDMMNAEGVGMYDKTSLNRLFTSRGSSIILRKNQTVDTLSIGENVFMIKRGYIKRFLTTKDGRYSIQSVYGPDNFFPSSTLLRHIFGYISLSSGKFYQYGALTEVQVYSLKIEELQKELDANPVLYKDLLAEAWVRLQSNIHRLDNMSLRSAYKQVADQLLFLSDKFGKETDGSISINFPINQQDLASMLDLTRETVSRTVIRLKAHGYIATTYKSVIILDPEGLRRIAS